MLCTMSMPSQRTVDKVVGQLRLAPAYAYCPPRASFLSTAPCEQFVWGALQALILTISLGYRATHVVRSTWQRKLRFWTKSRRETCFGLMTMFLCFLFNWKFGQFFFSFFSVPVDFVLTGINCRCTRACYTLKGTLK